MRSRFLACLVLLLLGITAVHAQDFLDPAVAFKLQAQRNGAQLQLNWSIEPGYHLYSERIEVKAVGSGLELGALNKPVGKQEFDKNFGKNMELYTGKIAISAPIIRVPQGANELQIEVTSQGCADAGLCYPPQQVIVRVPGGDAGISAGGSSSIGSVAAGADRRRVALGTAAWLSNRSCQNAPCRP